MTEGQQTNLPKLLSPASVNQRLIAAAIFMSITAGFALAWLMGQFHFTIYPFPCGFKQQYNFPCPTCGMTTAVIAFSHGHILNSFYIQPAAGFLSSIAVLIAFFSFLIAVFGVYSPLIEKRLLSVKLRYIFAFFIVVFAVGWGLTLIRALAQNSTG